MTISKKGGLWRSDNPSDIRRYLVFFAERSSAIDAFPLSQCDCGSSVLYLFDEDETASMRKCVACAKEHFICDSAEYWRGDAPDQYACTECEGVHANIGVGFSLYADKSDVRWLYISVRSDNCGALGCFSEWKVGYSPSLRLIDLTKAVRPLQCDHRH